MKVIPQQGKCQTGSKLGRCGCSGKVFKTTLSVEKSINFGAREIGGLDAQETETSRAYPGFTGFFV